MGNAVALTYVRWGVQTDGWLDGVKIDLSISIGVLRRDGWMDGVNVI